MFAPMRTLSFIRTIGAGSFGTVYLAELSSGQGFRRRVAVKVLHSEGPNSDMFLSRIRDEARLLGLLQDDAILKVIDMVDVEGRDAIIMEYVEGVDLESLSTTLGKIPARALCEVGAAVAGALGRAHKARHPTSGEPLNVIHRDVKPANIMITSSGGVKLLDFGIARARFDSRESYTGQLVLGTLNYMAPEYIVTGEVSPAADVYGLALALWQGATGQVYGQAKVRQDAHEARLRERLGQLDVEYGPLAGVLKQMMAWEPVNRPTAERAEELLWDAADAASGPGLRRWAPTRIREVLARRKPASDGPKLLGRTVSIGAGVDIEPAENAQQPTGVPLARPKTTASTPRALPVDPARSNGFGADTSSPSVGSGSFAPGEMRSASTHGRAAQASGEGAAPDSRVYASGLADPPPSQSGAAPASGDSTTRLILKGLLIGGTIGFVVVLIGLVVLIVGWR